MTDLKGKTYKSITGLTSKEVLESRAKHGANVLTPPKQKSMWALFGEKFKDPLILILIGALALSVAISYVEMSQLGRDSSALLEPLGIFVAITLATTVGFFVEVSANKKFQLLNKVNDDVLVKVYRDGTVKRVHRPEVVVGDIVMLEAGEEIPADGNLIESVGLSVNESTLTGEPMVHKSHKPADAQPDATYPTNRLLRGTIVMEGHCMMRVDKVGDSTEYGGVYTEAQIESGVKTPLTVQFSKLGKVITIGSFSAAALLLIGRVFFYFMTDATYTTAELVTVVMQSVMLAVTLIVVSVPEGLPMSVTMSLALSMRRMLISNNLVRKMHACETMGAVTVICTDKTGTLTRNQMRVWAAEFFGLKGGNVLADDFKSNLVREALSCNSTAFLDRSNPEQPQAIGNPTEGALLLWLNDANTNYTDIRQDSETLQQLPFSTERKFMATVVRGSLTGKRMLYVKGASEILFKYCSGIEADAITQADVMAHLRGYQDKAMRTIGFAYKELADDELPIGEGALLVNDLTFMGIVAISDPVRDDVPQAIGKCSDAGIAVKIVTGDTPGTAREIGRQVGIITENDGPEAEISGAEFAELSDDVAYERVAQVKVMSRARPADKQRLVSLLQRRGEVVAVTGDGTNDAPALNKAHVGLSMGDGTSVAKEASDITIMDNSFASITKSVMWGRSLYINIQRFVLFQLAVNIVACFMVSIGAFICRQSPLNVTQMLWVNLIMDTFAALALASLPPSEDVMLNKPRRATDFIITKKMTMFLIVVGGMFVAFLFGLLQYFKVYSVTGDVLADVGNYFRAYLDFSGTTNDLRTHEYTMFFTVFVFMQFWNLFNAKAFASNHSAFFKWRQSKVFFFTLLAILVGQILIVRFGGAMFEVESLTFTEWVVIVAGTSLVLWIGELWRFFTHRRKG